MRRWNLGVLILSLVLLPGPAPAKAQDGGANAALKYWTGFALLPTLDKEQEKLLEEWNKVPLDAAARKLIDRSQRSRVYLHRGTQLQRCDWSENYDDGIHLVMPNLPKSMILARLTTLHARSEFEQAHWKVGAEDVVDLLKLARHLEMDHVIIPNLVGIRIRSMAFQAAAPYLPDLKQVLPEAALAVLDAPPTAATAVQMVQMEKQIGAQALIQELKETEQRQPGSWQRFWKDTFSKSEGADQPVPQPGQSFEQTVKMLEDALSFYDEQAKMVALPGKEFDAHYAEFIKITKAANPVASYLLPAMDHVIAAQHRSQGQTALFKAALAVVQGGPDKLKEIKDPFGDGPFAYRTLDKGFELKSKLLVNGQPLGLTVGQR